MRGRPGKLGAWLGLFAILLVFCAPVVSQTLRALDPVRLAYLDVCSTADEIDHGGHQGHDLAAHGDACAYCSFAHVFPALTGHVVTIAAITWRMQVAALPAAQVRWGRVAVHTQPRGPPSIA
jgi:hypothetical protein